MLRYKASEIPRNEAYPAKGGTAMTRDEDNAVDGRFPAAS
jgi:hypothetical protein